MYQRHQRAFNVDRDSPTVYVDLHDSIGNDLDFIHLYILDLNVDDSPYRSFRPSGDRVLRVLSR